MGWQGLKPLVARYVRSLPSLGDRHRCLGHGNVGRAAIRAVEAHPKLRLAAVLVHNPVDDAVRTEAMGEFAAGTQGAVRFEVQGIVEGEPRIVIEHVTRIHPSCAPDWPTPPTGEGAHRVIIEGRPRIEVTIEATDEGGNTTAVGRLVGGIDWLVHAAPGLYDALDVPLRPSVGTLGRKQP